MKKLQKLVLMLLTLMLVLAPAFSVWADEATALTKKAGMNVGETIAFTVEGGSTDWKSSKPTVATVDENGVVTAVKAGKTVISTKAGLLTKKCTLTVYNPTIKLNKKEATLYYGGTATKTLKLKYSAKGARKDITWTSSNESVATVENGTVKPVGVGEAIITATANGESAECKVTVLETAITLDNSELLLTTTNKTEKTGKVKANVVGSSKKVKWTVDNKKVCSVKSGKVTAKTPGVATITATANGVSATATVKVQNAAIGDGYNLLWADEFNGNALDTTKWNYEIHDPGWVNNEEQSYVQSEDNVYVKDGLLTIQALKDEEGNITSGRINTQNKMDVKYGKIVARAKVPSGQGFLPAFWMMPTNESLYGQWPKCGEIDIMEVLGNDTKTTYSTLHFGEPHTQRQVSYKLKSGDFASAFHEFALEWEPGKMTYYVDGKKIGTEDDWFTKVEGDDEVEYPAPYDQTFYAILNLAVGGDWTGKSDETTKFDENAQLQVDYVRVYQKDEYNENVTKPEKPVTFREPDADGNLILNGNFAKRELGPTKAWNVLYQNGGKGSAKIANKTLIVKTENAGTEDYSVQVVQPGVPAKKGVKYTLTFDAYADEARTMTVGVTAPDLNYKRYLNDTTVALGTDKTADTAHYSYEYTMTGASDANARLEFNLGNTASTATVYISNVKLVAEGDEDTSVAPKSVLSDGNFVYNGSFDRGYDKTTRLMKYWEYEETDGVEIKNVNRKLVVSAANGTAASDVVVTQKSLGIIGEKDLRLSFKASATKDSTISVYVGDQKFDAELTSDTNNFVYQFTTTSETNRPDLKLCLGSSGAVTIDDIRLEEDAILINGNFSNGLAGYSQFVNGASATFSIDELNNGGNKTLAVDIKDTGDADWKIQLIQYVKLEKDKYYRLSYDARSTKNRKIIAQIQHDPDNHMNSDGAKGDYANYAGTSAVELTSEMQTFTKEFKMTRATNEYAKFNICFGGFDGNQITTPHTVYVDNIVLEEIEAPEIPEDAPLLVNGDFSDGMTGYGTFVDPSASAELSVKEINDNKVLAADVSDTGDADWKIQLTQYVKLEKDKYYRLSYDARSTKNRKIIAQIQHDPDNHMNSDGAKGDYANYAGTSAVELTSEMQTFTKEFKMTRATNEYAKFNICFGGFDGNQITTPHTVYVDNIVLEEIEAPETPETPADDGSDIGVELVRDRKFEAFDDNWSLNKNGTGAAVVSSLDGNEAVINVTNPGMENWHVQLAQYDITLREKAGYTLSFDVESSEDRQIDYSVWCGKVPNEGYLGSNVQLTADTPKHVSYEVIVPEGKGGKADLLFSFGKSEGKDTPASVIKIKNISLKRENLILDAGFTTLNSEGSLWQQVIGGKEINGAATYSLNNGVLTVDVTNVGDQDWSVQLKQAGLCIQTGESYTLSFDVKSEVTRTIKAAVLTTSYAWCGGADVSLTGGDATKPVSVDFTVDKDVSNGVFFALSFGKLEGEDTPTGKIEISNLSLKKK